MSMNDFSLTMTIDQRPAAVFAFLAEPAYMTRWYDAVDYVDRTAGAPVEAGTKFEIGRSLPGGRATNLVKITEYEVNRRITLESQQGPTPFRYRYIVQPIGSGTKLTLDGRISSEGLAGPAAHLGAFATALFKRGMQRNLNLLKRLIESDQLPSLEHTRGQPDAELG